MKSTQANPTTILATLAAAFLLAASAQAAIIGINSAASSASINFDDTNSIGPLGVGIMNTTVTANPWTGAMLPLTIPPGPLVAAITSDTAYAELDASFIGDNYAVDFSSVSLNQGFLGSTAFGGFAQMHILFNVEFQLDGAGLPAQPTLFPGFFISGTVQATPGSFAFFGGVINYYKSGNPTPIETVNYNWNYTNPPNSGSFGPLPVFGAPVNGSTPGLAAGTTLTLNGNFSFVVDPAIMYAESQMVPEPSSAVLALLSLPLLLRRRRG